MLLALPLCVYYLWYCLEFNHGRPALPSAEWLRDFPAPTATSVGIVAGWLAFQALLQIAAPGRWTEGPELPDGTRLAYKMNGWSAWWITWSAIAAALGLGLFPPTILADQFGPLITTANMVAFLLSLYLYRHGRKFAAPYERATGNPIYDFWLGSALNPRIGRFDLKLFCEARPGLIAWVAIDLSLAAKQHALNGFVSVPMILVCLFQFWYVADYFFHE